MRRLDKTLADYVAIAISPALIMLMVGSLLWFLVAVFYQGGYGGRINWILACYTVAIVLITRISIEEGQERAAMFGVALALATGFATMRFSSSMFFHWILLGLAWWAAHKLTMDCTLIDEEQDSSGQGLLQLVGFRKKAEQADKENGEDAAKKEEAEPADPEGVTDRVEKMREEAHPKRRTKGKGHAPGTWIVYFSLAALPLFGLGQMLVPVADSARRLWTFQLLAVYVAAGLGLLVTTSFLGLRRYLRQRGVQMPPQMAGVWIALGATIIVVLLAVCAIVPRPAAEYQAARMPDFPLKFTTPDRESNRYAMGDEGADKNNPDSRSRTQGQQDGTKPEGGKSDNPESGGEKGSKAKEGHGNKKSKDGKSQGSSQGDKKSESGSKQDSSQSQDSSSNESRQDQQSADNSNQNQGESRQQNPDKSESRNDRSDSGGRNGEQKQSQEDRQGKEGDANSSDRHDESERNEASDSKNEERPESERREEDSRSGDSQDRSGSSEDRREENREQQDQEHPERSDRGGSSGTRTERPDSPSFQLPQVSLSGGLFGMLKFLIYIVLGCVIAWWLMKNWSRVVEGFRLFLQELREFWASLFGGKPKEAKEELGDVKPAAKKHRPFTDYVDPFSAGLADRYAPDELVRYTFEATEAWARENGCPRDPDQTPHEFAALLGRRVESLRPGAVTLAKLYSQVAYAPGSLAGKSAKPLGDFWQRLRTSHGTVVPPPPPVETPVG